MASLGWSRQLYHVKTNKARNSKQADIKYWMTETWLTLKIKLKLKT